MTWAEVLREVKACHTGIDDTTAKLYIQQALDELSDQYPINPGRTSLILTSGTGEYAIASGSPFYQFGSASATSSLPLLRIRSVIYYDGTAGNYELPQEIIESLDNKYPGWKYEDSGTPTFCYIN